MNDRDLISRAALLAELSRLEGDTVRLTDVLVPVLYPEGGDLRAL